MREYELEILEQYDVELKSTRRVRGAFFCDTKEGTMLLKESAVSEQRAILLHKMLLQLAGDGYPNVDTLVATKEGQFVSTSRDGTQYMLKKWFYGRECDVRREQEVLEAAGNLATLHQKMHWDQEQETEGISVGRHLKEEFFCHNRELRKVRAFIRNKVGKGEFEYLFLQHFEQMFRLALLAGHRLEHSGYESLYRESIENRCLIHGDYNYHNVLFLNQPFSGETATTGFEHFRMDVQVQDLYYFLRKVMEKHRWDERLGRQILEAYGSVRPLKPSEQEYLAVKLLYPEKFWKIANTYYHSNKAWLPEKNVEKLKLTIAQSEEKLRFLEHTFSFLGKETSE